LKFDRREVNKLKAILILWGPFAGSSLLIAVIYETLWSSHWYYHYLSLFGILSVALAGIILFQTGMKRWPIIFVSLGLLCGQFWLVKRLITLALWGIVGHWGARTINEFRACFDPVTHRARAIGERACLLGIDGDKL
jgi:hypothetical protein